MPIELPPPLPNPRKKRVEEKVVERKVVAHQEKRHAAHPFGGWTPPGILSRYLCPFETGREMTERESTLLAGRVKRFEQLLGRPLPPPPAPAQPPLQAKEREHLLGAAEDLYWNELEWEKLTGEERLDEEFLTEMAFPGFLAFIRGLLLTVTMPDSLAPPRPSPEVVEDVLGFLATRVVDLEEQASDASEEDREHREVELKMTSRLIDLVVYQLHGLGTEEVAKVELALASE